MFIPLKQNPSVNPKRKLIQNMTEIVFFLNGGVEIKLIQGSPRPNLRAASDKIYEGHIGKAL